VKIFATEADNLNEVFNAGNPSEPLTVELPCWGFFKQKVHIKRDNVIILGNNSSIFWDDHNGMVPGFGTGDSATLTIEGSNVAFSEINIVNSFDYWKAKARREENPSIMMGLQAVAVFITPGSDNVTFDNSILSSWQDTLFTDGANGYFDECTIKGNVDFIFGRSNTTFENCTIVSLGPGYVTAPSTMADQEEGLVFNSCSLVRDNGVPDESVYLARPWHPSGKPGVCSAVSFNSCSCGGHINSSLWTTMKDSKGVLHTPEESRFFFGA
jgi:pectinesterase